MFLNYFRSKNSPDLKPKVEIQPTLDDLLNRLSKDEINENKFINLLKLKKIPPRWVERNLRVAYNELDEKKISYLLNCIVQDSFLQSTETKSVTSLYCEILEDPRCYRLAEEIADALGYCALEKSALRSFVNVCTSPIWEQKGWPDLRKALESMYGMYQSNTCTLDEIIAAFQEILASPNTANEWRGIRDGARTFINMIQRDSKIE